MLKRRLGWFWPRPRHEARNAWVFIPIGGWDQWAETLLDDNETYLVLWRLLRCPTCRWPFFRIFPQWRIIFWLRHILLRDPIPRHRSQVSSRFLPSNSDWMHRPDVSGSRCYTRQVCRNIFVDWPDEPRCSDTSTRLSPDVTYSDDNCRIFSLGRSFRLCMPARCIYCRDCSPRRWTERLTVTAIGSAKVDGRLWQLEKNLSSWFSTFPPFEGNPLGRKQAGKPS